MRFKRWHTTVELSDFISLLKGDQGKHEGFEDLSLLGEMGVWDDQFGYEHATCPGRFTGLGNSNYCYEHATCPGGFAVLGDSQYSYEHAIRPG